MPHYPSQGRPQPRLAAVRHPTSREPQDRKSESPRALPFSLLGATLLAFVFLALSFSLRDASPGLVCSLLVLFLLFILFLS